MRFQNYTNRVSAGKVRACDSKSFGRPNSLRVWVPAGLTLLAVGWLTLGPGRAKCHCRKTSPFTKENSTVRFQNNRNRLTAGLVRACDSSSVGVCKNLLVWVPAGLTLSAVGWFKWGPGGAKNFYCRK